MYDMMISLLAPAGRQRVDAWVEQQVDRIREACGPSGVLLGRLVKAHPAQGGDWLIKVDRRARSGPPERDVALAAIVAELEWLGLRPAVFVSTGRVPRLAETRRRSHAPARRLAARCGPRSRRSPPI
jgi:hypothetical protein